MENFEHARKKLNEIKAAKVEAQKFLQSLEIAFGRYNDFGLMLVFMLKELEKRKKQAEKRLNTYRKNGFERNEKRPLTEPEDEEKNLITEDKNG